MVISMQNVFEKMGIVTQIYSKKVNSIKEKYQSDDDRCLSYQEDIYDTSNFDQILDASSDFTMDNANDILAAAKNIEAQNKQAQLQSCAVIY